MAEIKAMIARGEYSPTPSDAPEAEPMPEGFWDRAKIVYPHERKASIHLRVDPDVLKWFKEQG
ncbi:MAG: BrnA antitoxin family protein, partial [Proteobacteria bacterium]|nr:BrnA antitoxin family protein [Pseudomonadota bacterium]